MGACRAGASGSRGERPLSEACPTHLPRQYLRRHRGVWGGVRWRQEGLGWGAPGQRNALGAARSGVSQVSTVAPGIQRNRWQDWGLPALGRREAANPRRPHHGPAPSLLLQRPHRLTVPGHWDSAPTLPALQTARCGHGQRRLTPTGAAGRIDPESPHQSQLHFGPAAGRTVRLGRGRSSRWGELASGGWDCPFSCHRTLMQINDVQAQIHN